MRQRISSGTFGQVLICGSNAAELHALSILLAPEGYQASTASSPLDAIREMTSSSVNAVILLVEPGDSTWLDSIPVVNQLLPMLPIIVAGGESLETEKAARRGRIFYYLPKPLDMLEVTAVLRDATGKGGRGGRFPLNP